MGHWDHEILILRLNFAINTMNNISVKVAVGPRSPFDRTQTLHINCRWFPVPATIFTEETVLSSKAALPRAAFGVSGARMEIQGSCAMNWSGRMQ